MGERYLKSEEENIRKYYPYATRPKILEKIPERTWEQIGVHARTMRVLRTPKAKGNSVREGRKQSVDGWSDAANEKFDAYFPIATHKELLRLFPNRTWLAITSHAEKRHLYRTAEAISREMKIGQKKARKENES